MPIISERSLRWKYTVLDISMIVPEISTSDDLVPKTRVCVSPTSQPRKPIVPSSTRTCGISLPFSGIDPSRISNVIIDSPEVENSSKPYAENILPSPSALPGKTRSCS